MIGMALPMCVLFELSVLWAYFYDRRLARRRAAEEAAELPDDVPSQIDPLPEQLSAERGERTESNWSDLP
jgi:hypothetical protein